MDVLTMSFFVWVSALLAGFIGSLTGLGGGVVVVPVLALVFGVDIRYAIGASLLSVIATSSGAAAAYVKEGFSNIRIGMLLEVATTLGALFGATLAAWISTRSVAVVFGMVLLGSAALSFRKMGGDPVVDSPPDRIATALRLGSSYPTPAGPVSYSAHRVPAGFGMMFVAGALSGLLGIGSGALKVIAMDDIMRLPFKVSTTTSNFMIGVTAAASAGIYILRGYLDPALTFPVVLGVLPGALAGARLLPRLHSRVLRLVFAVVIVVLALEMLYNGWTGRV
jgi:uncharacterized protein